MDKSLQKYVQYRWHAILLSISLLLTYVVCIEEDQPAIFLRPRNFNPHPYVADYNHREAANSRSRGPVLFPRNPEDDPENNAINTNSLVPEAPRRDFKLNHPIDHHPYAKVARKHKYRFPGRFNQDNRINPRVYEALSSHAAKVLSEPPSQLGKDYSLSSLSNEKKNYAFSYKVVDHLTGDDFSHTQSQDSKATNGEYRVKLPDGRLQIVSYTADKNGYKADVKYTKNDISSENIQIQRGPDATVKAQIRPAPVLKTNSYIGEYNNNNNYHHQYDDISGSHFQTQLPAYDVLFAPPLPTQQQPNSHKFHDQNHHHHHHQQQHRHHHQDYEPYITATPSPVLFHHHHHTKAGVIVSPTPPVHYVTASNIHHHPKVEIYTNNNEFTRINSNYIGTTAVPYVFEHGKRFHHHQQQHRDEGGFVSSTPAPTAVVYITTPKYRIVQDLHRDRHQHGGLVYGK